MSRLRNLLGLSYVPRWCTHPMTRSQSVAEHSYRVAVIALEIQEKLALRCPGMLRWALVHDGPECLTGDIPAPMKHYVNVDLSAVSRYCTWYHTERQLLSTTDDHDIVHLADIIESLSWAAAFGGKIAKDHFDGQNVEYKLRCQVHKEAEAMDERFPGLYTAIKEILAEVAP